MLTPSRQCVWGACVLGHQERLANPAFHAPYGSPPPPSFQFPLLSSVWPAPPPLPHKGGAGRFSASCLCWQFHDVQSR
eukprot:jgi/Botrbrau1/21526/Bobra.174_2s0029.1